MELPEGFVTLRDFNALPVEIRALQALSAPPVLSDWCDTPDPDQIGEWDRTKNN